MGPNGESCVPDAVPRYFFDLFNDVDVTDEEGCALPDLEAARAHATSEARTMIQAGIVDGGKIDLDHRIEVRDEAGTVVCVVRFAEAVQILRAGEPVLTG